MGKFPVVYPVNPRNKRTAIPGWSDSASTAVITGRKVLGNKLFEYFFTKFDKPTPIVGSHHNSALE
ncbi:hypothetical protein BH09ACT8_BH09ACT8_12980 [soil metagenome]